MGNSARDRLVRAAFELFAERGYERTTVEDIASHAGVGRTTFFRHFPAKDAVVLPDHDAILAGVDARLAAGQPSTAPVALYEAARIVLRHYLDEGEVARARYGLTRAVPALRDAEMTGQRRYQRLFRAHLNTWLDSEGRGSDLRAELVANAVVTAHNHVLRSWLRGRSEDPEAELAAAFDDVVPRLWNPGRGSQTQVLVLRTARDVDEIVPQLRRLLDGDG